MEMADLFGRLERSDMGFLCIRPLYQGILTDQRAGQDSLREGDRFAQAKFADDFAKRAKIAETFESEIGQSMTRFAVRFVLAAPVVASVIVGLNTPEQVDGIVSAVEDDLPSADVIAKAQDLWRSGLGLG